MDGLRIGFAISGSFCTFSRVLQEIRVLADKGAQIIPILSFNAATIDTRFGTARELHEKLEEITGRKPMETLVEVEPIGPKALLDILVVAPCTGSTLGRIANGISDTPVTLAVKSHLRRDMPVVLGISTNDALGASMRNISLLKNTKQIFLVPFRQDDPLNKPNSLMADFSLLENTIKAAREGIQLQPLFI
ncbi:MAG: dipicolinate synthase subunit B [Oscillospiraceae bacterium]|nr:dipicolinate synthase subunit B [Oscillospiraceae bacterium]MDD4413502.1 dipicolinate synthase subunit B [Oscillospiraceae bacterium]